MIWFDVQFMLINLTFSHNSENIVERVIKKDLLTVVLTILADGESGRQCQVTVGNKEIYLEDVEALEFLWKKEDDRSREEVDRRDDDRERTKSLSVLNSFFVESFTSEWGRHHRSADGRKRGRKRACCSHVHSAKSHFLIKGL